MNLYLPRGIEDDHYIVVQEVDGMLSETPWRVEREWNGWVLSHADDGDLTDWAHNLGAFLTPTAAVQILRDML
ncbi:hypothetical protein [Herbiconiux sp. YIM B11900]|uniref:hypothetical protein n=1 Tax=Herbiconiux sp. YIM B11900 TaxID=3404131 RepID=UPI003F830983